MERLFQTMVKALDLLIERRVSLLDKTPPKTGLVYSPGWNEIPSDGGGDIDLANYPLEKYSN
jgi:hypothetical protein